MIFQDGRQSEGWQAPQQAWAPLVKSKESVLSYDQSHDTARSSGYHRPVTMQWSDPLTSGNMWPSTGKNSYPDTIFFGADPIGISIRFHFCALSFDQTCIDTLLGGGEEFIRFW